MPAISPSSTLERPVWSEAFERPEMGSDWVDVWRVQSGEFRFGAGDWDGCLSTEERERADRFRFEKDQHSYRVSHTVKRWVLSRYIPIDPAEFQFGAGEWGKPYLVELPSEYGLQFNLSHSRGETLIAVSQGMDVGVDVEQMQTVERMAPIFKRFASTSEQVDLSESPGRLSGKALTTWWVAKESFVKVVGRGLSLSLSEFTVGMPDGQPWRLTAIPSEFGETRDYELKLFEVGDHHLGGLVCRGRNVAVRTFAWRQTAGRSS